MEQQLYSQFKTTTLSPSTATLYAKKLSQWIQSPLTILQTTPPHQLLASLKSHPAIKQTPTNLHIYISALVAYIQHVAEDKATLAEWRAIQKENWAPRAAHYTTGQPTPQQSDKIVSREQITTTISSLAYATLPRLLLSMYSKVEPIRADYFATEILTDPRHQPIEDNYITFTTDSTTITIRDFKTKKKYTTLTIPIPAELVTEIRHSLTILPRRYLFTQTDNPTKPFTRKTFSNWATRTLTSIFKQPMTLTALRHIYISSIDFNSPIQTLETTANRMGHSIEMQRRYAWTPSNSATKIAT